MKNASGPFGVVGSILVAFASPALFPASSAAQDPNTCAALEDPNSTALLSGARESGLIEECGLFPPPPSSAASLTRLEPPLINDRLVNDPLTDDNGAARFTQNETSVLVANNTVCVAFNDNGDVTGIRSDGAFSQSDLPFIDAAGPAFPDVPPAFPLDPNAVPKSLGDPSLAYRALDDTFYYASLTYNPDAIWLWKSTDNCQTWTPAGAVHLEGDCPDKELLAIDNSISSPFFGRMYVGYTRFLGCLFSSGSRNQIAFTDDPAETPNQDSWSNIKVLGETVGRIGQGMWPAIAPNGDVYFALLDRNIDPGGTQSQWIFRSVDGGSNWTQRTNIASDLPRPENAAASAAPPGGCGKSALNGFIRHLASPQIAIHPDPDAEVGYTIHAVYAYDSDGPGPDESNVFYKRSTDGALNWSSETPLNDDGTATDQWYPALAVNDAGVVVVSWYDRRLDPVDNLKFDRFLATSHDGGISWSKNVRISDASSRVARILDGPAFQNIPPCYHGDYDQIAIEADNTTHVVWSDDRNELPPCPIDPQNPEDPFLDGCPDPDVFYEKVEDFDGDGILDLLDGCPTIANTGVDGDGDGVDNACDTCLGFFNPALADPTSIDPAFPGGWMTLVSGQRDDDADGAGNRCDADFDQEGAVVGGQDLADQREAFNKEVASTLPECAAGSSPPPDGPCDVYDIDGVGALIGGGDLTLGRMMFNTQPGPACDGPDPDGDTIAEPCDPNPAAPSGPGSPGFFSSPGSFILNRAVCEGTACP